MAISKTRLEDVIPKVEGGAGNGRNAPKVPKAKSKKPPKATAVVTNYPRHSLEKVLRIPRAILDQNAGKECSEADSARYVGVGCHGPYRVEISSAIKYGLLERTTPGRLKVTDLARKILRPQNAGDEVQGLREAVLNAPVIADVYKHYRGENLPDLRFFENALVDTFGIPAENVGEFISIFQSCLETAKLAERNNDKLRILDVAQSLESDGASGERIKKLGAAADIKATDTCFIMMPFSSPLGNYYQTVYEPAIRKAGLTPVRADNEIFGTGKIMDQIWSGLNSAKVLIAELTSRNPNVFYELGLAHALQKPVVLVSSNEKDVPFDLQHIRVIYYDVMDPFWGAKLIDKVAENVISAVKNPEEAIFKRAVE